jgi:hypothetical protein
VNTEHRTNDTDIDAQVQAAFEQRAPKGPNRHQRRSQDAQARRSGRTRNAKPRDWKRKAQAKRQMSQDTKKQQRRVARRATKLHQDTIRSHDRR